MTTSTAGWWSARTPLPVPEVLAPVATGASRPLADAVSRPFRLLGGVVLLLLLLAGATAGVELAVLAPRLHQTLDAQEALRASEQAMVDQETGVRGYLLAPPPYDASYLEPFVAGTLAFDEAEPVLQAQHGGAMRAAVARRSAAALTWQQQWAGPATGEALGKTTSEPFLAQGKRMFEEYRHADRAVATALRDRVRHLLQGQRLAETVGGGVALAVVLGAMLAVRRARHQLLVDVAAPLADIAAAVRAGSAGDLDRSVASARLSELDGLGRDVGDLFASVRARDAALRAHVHELDVLGAASRALLSEAEPRSAVCRAAGQITGASDVFLLEPDGTGALVDTASLGRPPGGVVLPLDGEGLAVEVFHARRPVLVDDVHTDPRVAQHVAADVAPTGAAWVPVLADDRCLAVLVVALPPRTAVTPVPVLASLEVLAGAAAAAVQRVDLLARLAARTGAGCGEDAEVRVAALAPRSPVD